jgi:hypothetical protein
VAGGAARPSAASQGLSLAAAYGWPFATSRMNSNPARPRDLGYRLLPRRAVRLLSLAQGEHGTEFSYEHCF